MDKISALKLFSTDSKRIDSFRSIQEPAIDAILAGERVLCLMPTGEGKSLIYQVAGVCLEKAVIVISPLIALMKQQHHDLINKGFKSLFISELDFKQQFKELTNIARGTVPNFIFISPERAANDGYLEYVSNVVKDKIGLVVVDEAHCISQWGEGFRPAYKTIPDFLNRVFGVNAWPRILCLTATLNEADQKQIRLDFGITKTLKSPNLMRTNLDLQIIDLGSGKEEDTKDEALEKILERHRGEKILVFVHRKYGNKGTTKTLYKKFVDTVPDCAFFDADISDSEKDRVLEGFKDGSIKVVFATSAFGMGVDIDDIRVVVHYLISESIEQYYQEVGRAGRDGKPAYGYLFFTQQSRNGRRKLIENSLCSKSELQNEYENRELNGDTFGSIRYDELTDEQRIAVALLMEYGVLGVYAKGLQYLKSLKGIGLEGQAFLEEIRKIAPSGLTKVVCKKKGITINSLTSDIWRLCAKGELAFVSSPLKSIFYSANKELDDETIDKIMNDQEAKRTKRVNKFVEFVDAIERGEKANDIIKKGLNLD